MGVGPRTPLTVALVALLVASATVAAQDITEGDVRLTGGQDNSALNGLVQVYHDGAWLPICLKPWRDNLKIGSVMCRQLGFFGGAVSTYISAGQGSPTTWLEEVTCTGLEISLAECRDLTYGPSDCTQDEHAGLRCAHPMYEGCFRESNTGLLTSYSAENAGVDVSYCLYICSDKGTTYAGLHDGMVCSCGDMYSAHRESNSACDQPCINNAEETCGGTSFVSIYRTANKSEEDTGGYVTSSNFPRPYGVGDSATYQIDIPAEADYARVVFSHFQLATDDRVTLGSPDVPHNGDRDGVPPAWVTADDANSFTVTFTVAAGSPGSMGFALEYTFGQLCPRSALPVSIPDGSYVASQASYYLGDHVVVDCIDGYQGDRVGFVCQKDGSWSPAPVCTVLPTNPPPTTTAAPEVTTEPPTSAPSPSTEASTTEEEEETSPDTSVESSTPSPQSTPSLPIVPCPVPEVSFGTVNSGNRQSVGVGDTVTLTCNDSYEPAEGNTTATCLPNGEFDVGLLCSPETTFPVWLIVIIIVAAVLAIIVIVLVILLLLVHSEDKHRARHRPRAPPAYGSDDMRESPRDERLVAIPPSTHLGHSAVNSVMTDSDSGESGQENDAGAVHQGAQTDADPALGDIGDPSVGDAAESEAYHPTRDYPGAGRAPHAVSQPPQTVPPPAVARQRSVDYHTGPVNDFSMLPSEEMLALRALDNVVSDFERGDQGYYLGPSGPSPYNMDRANHYGSRQIQFSQRSRLSSFYGLY